MALVEALSMQIPAETLAQVAAEVAGCKRCDDLVPDPRAVAALPATFCRATLLVAVGRGPDGWQVAAADPTDAHAVAEAARLLRGPVKVRAARADSVLRMLGNPGEAHARAAFSLAGRSRAAQIERNARFASIPPRRPAAAPPAPVSASYELPSESFANELSWKTGATRRASGPRGPNDRRAPEAPRAPARRVEDLAPYVAALRAASTPDRVIETLLSLTLEDARQAFAFRVRQGSLVGMDSAGSTLGVAAIRRIELPLSPGSTAARVLDEGRGHFGPLGFSPTDQVLRAAIGSRGVRVSVHGLFIDSRPVALVLVDELATDVAGHEKLTHLAHAAGQVLKRLVVESATD